MRTRFKRGDIIIEKSTSRLYRIAAIDYANDTVWFTAHEHSGVNRVTDLGGFNCRFIIHSDYLKDREFREDLEEIING